MERRLDTTYVDKALQPLREGSQIAFVGIATAFNPFVEHVFRPMVRRQIYALKRRSRRQRMRY